jgi:hypothetical protein
MHRCCCISKDIEVVPARGDTHSDMRLGGGKIMVVKQLYGKCGGPRTGKRRDGCR